MPNISVAELANMSEAERRRLALTNVALGYHQKTDDAFIISNVTRHAGVYVIGKQGPDNSAFIQDNGWSNKTSQYNDLSIFHVVACRS